MTEADIRRFWRKVEKSDACWRWLGRPMTVGYGYFGRSEAGVKVDGYAHRMSWEIHYGSVPDGLCVLHRCDNRMCVNPAHLFLGTRTDNQADAAAKGRLPHGDRHWATKISEELIPVIMARLEAGETQVAVARDYGVSRQAVTNLVLRRRKSMKEAQG